MWTSYRGAGHKRPGRPAPQPSLGTRRGHPLEEGRYVWNLGYSGSAIFRVVALDDNVDNPLDAAGIYLRNDCGTQAKAAFEQVIAESAAQ